MNSPHLVGNLGISVGSVTSIMQPVLKTQFQYHVRFGRLARFPSPKREPDRGALPGKLANDNTPRTSWTTMLLVELTCRTTTSSIYVQHLLWVERARVRPYADRLPNVAAIHSNLSKDTSGICRIKIGARAAWIKGHAGSKH